MIYKVYTRVKSASVVLVIHSAIYILVLKGIHHKYHYILLLQITHNEMGFVGVVHAIVIKFSLQTLIYIYCISTHRMKVFVPFCPVKVISCFLQVSFVYEFPIHCVILLLKSITCLEYVYTKRKDCEIIYHHCPMSMSVDRYNPHVKF